MKWKITLKSNLTKTGKEEFACPLPSRSSVSRHLPDSNSGMYAQETCIIMFIALFFEISMIWKQLKCHRENGYFYCAIFILCNIIQQWKWIRAICHYGYGSWLQYRVKEDSCRRLCPLWHHMYKIKGDTLFRNKYSHNTV